MISWTSESSRVAWNSPWILRHVALESCDEVPVHGELLAPRDQVALEPARFAANIVTSSSWSRATSRVQILDRAFEGPRLADLRQDQ